MTSRPASMTAIPDLKHSNEGFDTENLRQCKNCGHWIYYWCLDHIVTSPKGWYHYVNLYNPRVSDKLQSKNRKRCFGHKSTPTKRGHKRVVCTCVNPEPDPAGKTWDEVHKGIS